MKTNENMYREIVETAQEGIWVTDSNYIVSYVNTKAAEMLGYIKRRFNWTNVHKLYDRKIFPNISYEHCQ